MRAGLFLLVAVACGSAAGDDAVFELSEIASSGRIVSAEFGDFDGDGRSDVMIATLAGIPPQESRTISVHLQRPDGRYAEAPDHSVPIPRFSAVYDIADVRESPGEELVLLRPDRVTILSLADGSGSRWDLPVDGPSTVAAADDERGFDPFRLVYDEFGAEPWILVPQIGRLTAMTASGDVVAAVDVGRRANYYVAKRPGVVSVESDIQLFLDVPKVSVGDVDGDGRADIVAATRHEIRVFLQDGGGRFAAEPSRALALGLLSEQDHVRGSGSVVTTARDIDGDGRLDLMITAVEGTFTDTVTTTYLYRNREGGWNPDEADDRFESKGAWSSDLLLDVDGDDVLELVRIQVRFSLLEIVELLLTREIDAVISIHRLAPDGSFEADPWTRRKISTGLNFETFRPKGFMPQAGVDVNADGLPDFVTSADGRGIEIYLGGEGGPLDRRAARQEFNTTGVIRFADYDADGLPDFLLYDSQAFDAPLRLGRNLGLLPKASAD